MNVVPAFLRLAEKQEPAVPQLPPRSRPEELRETASTFMNQYDRLREEAAYLRADNEQMRVDLKVANEQVRALQAELNFVRDDRDRLLQHDSMMLGGLDDIEVLIINLKQRARAEAYAPPGSGQQDHSQAGDELAAGVADLAKKLAPAEHGDAQP